MPLHCVKLTVCVFSCVIHMLTLSCRLLDSSARHPEQEILGGLLHHRHVLVSRCQHTQHFLLRRNHSYCHQVSLDGHKYVIRHLGESFHFHYIWTYRSWWGSICCLWHTPFTFCKFIGGLKFCLCVKFNALNRFLRLLCFECFLYNIYKDKDLPSVTILYNILILSRFWVCSVFTIENWLNKIHWEELGLHTKCVSVGCSYTRLYYNAIHKVNTELVPAAFDFIFLHWPQTWNTITATVNRLYTSSTSFRHWMVGQLCPTRYLTFQNRQSSHLHLLMLSVAVFLICCTTVCVTFHVNNWVQRYRLLAWKMCVW